MEVVATIVGKVWECLFDVTWRQFGYLNHYRHSSGRLRNHVQNLAHTKERVQGKIDEATGEGKIILTDVINWMEKVDDITEEAEDFIAEKENEEANKRCLKGLCIDPWSRYRLGKKAHKKIVAISNLLEEEARRFDTVSRKAPPPAAVIVPSSASSVNFKSRESITNQIMETLNEEEVSIVGICGMGGVGKTTLVKEISKQVMEKKLYDSVAMVVVSQTQSYVKIQREIASMLGFIIPDEEESARASFLWENIMKKEKPEQKPKRNRKLKGKREEKQEEKQERELERILIILDDVWEGIQMEKVGIPFGETRRGCKIVLTSRSEDVCLGMDAKTFTVGTLPRGESWSMFREVAGEIVDNPDINPIAREVADECGGLPIALVTVAGALKNRKSKYVWIDAAKQLKKSAPTNIKGMDEKVFASLELSYNFLANEEEKSVFLLCCLFPEDFEIPVEVLVRYGQGLRLFEDVDTLEEARYRTHTVVSTLIASFLLISTSGPDHVKMHDVVRDVAIKLSKDKHNMMAKASVGLQEWPSAATYENFTVISLMNNHIREVPDGMECPKLQALLLQQNPLLVTSNNFFKGMKDLKVLDMSCISKLPMLQSLLLLANLTTLYLNNCMFGDADISLIGQLKNLEILSLRHTDIAKIPEEFGELGKLRLFDLTGCSNLREIPHAVILCFKKLEELFVNQKGLFFELQAWCRQTTLRIYAREAGVADSLGHAILSNRMPSEKQTSFVVQIGFGILILRHLETCTPRSRILNIRGIRFQPVDWSYQLLTKITEVLQLGDIVGLRNILLDLGNHGFNDVKCLQLSDCKEITYLLNTLECSRPCSVFNGLESLLLECNPDLVEICCGPLPPKSFSKLNSIYVSTCTKMINIIPRNLLQKLDSLESLEAYYCTSVVYIFDFERLVIVEGETKLLSSLKNIRLVALPEMTQICNGDVKLISLCNLKRISVCICSNLRQVFPPALLQSLYSLEDVEISHCDRLEEIFGKVEVEEEVEQDHQTNEIVVLKIDHTTTSNLGNLTTIRILDCPKLKTLFTPSIAKGLVQLRTLDVRHCRTMEAIISDGKAETGPSTQRAVFPSLYEIYLADLACLTCFCAGWCTLEFEALELVSIQGCPKMETFGRSDQVTHKLTVIKLDFRKRWMDNLNITVQQFFREKQEQYAASRKNNR